MGLGTEIEVAIARGGGERDHGTGDIETMTLPGGEVEAVTTITAGRRGDIGRIRNEVEAAIVIATGGI
jgi:hypothetical protein